MAQPTADDTPEPEPDCAGKRFEDLTPDEKMELAARFMDRHPDLMRAVANLHLGAEQARKDLYNRQVGMSFLKAIHAEGRHFTVHVDVVEGERVYHLYRADPKTGQTISIPAMDILEALDYINGEGGVLKKCVAECKLWKPLYAFSKRKTSADGRNNRCKMCERKRVKEYNENKAQTRKCRLCHLRKPLECFHKNKSRPGGVRYECKECLARRE